MKVKRILAIVLATIMALAVLTACGGNSKPEGTIGIGGIGPITGTAAIYGNAVKNGAEIAIEEINAKDGIKLSFRFEDDENDTEKSINSYNVLKDWGMQILMGTVTTTPCVPVSGEANTDKIFTLTPSASSTDVIGGFPNDSGVVEIPRKDCVFQICFTDPNQGIASAEYIKTNDIASKVAIIYNSGDAYSTGIYNKFVQRAAELGLEVVSVTSFPNDETTDFSVQLTEAKNSGADLVFLPIYYTPASLIIKQADSAGYDFKFFGCDGLDGLLTLKGFDTTLAEGVMLLTPFVADAQDQATKDFVAKYQEKFGEIPTQFAADGYDAIYAIYEACVKAGVTADMSAAEISEKLIDVFTNGSFEFNGLTGTGVTWSSTGEVSKAPKGMIIKDGAYTAM